jgi:hypothetical protein
MQFNSASQVAGTNPAGVIPIGIVVDVAVAIVLPVEDALPLRHASAEHLHLARNNGLAVGKSQSRNQKPPLWV